MAMTFSRLAPLGPYNAHRPTQYSALSTKHSALSTSLLPENQVVAVDDLVEVVVVAQLVGSLAADLGELRRRVVGQAAADARSIGPDEGHQIAGLEGAFDARDADR